MSAKANKTLVQCSGPADVPEGRHYAIIIYNTESVTIEGDERSRTNPGHGYPEETRTFNTFEHWVTRDQYVWEDFIQALVVTNNSKSESNKKRFVAFEVAGKAELTTRTQVTIKVT